MSIELSSKNHYFLWVITLTSTLIIFWVVLILQDQPIKNLSPIAKLSPSPNLNIPLPEKLQLHDVSLDWNLNFSHQQRTKNLTAITDTLGSGVCAFDYNNDGWTDLYFVGGSGNTRRYGRTAWWHKTTGGRLYRNHQGQYLQDVTSEAGVEFTISGIGCAVEDINADGFEDILITGIDAIHLFKNNGNGSFSDISKQSGITVPGWSTGAAFGDFNNDGLPDLYIAKFIKFKKDATTFEAQSGFQSYDSAAFQSSLYDAEPNHLYLNTGNYTFKDVTEKFKVANQNGRSYGARWIDINSDNWLDLIVINQPPSPNEVYINKNGNEFILANSIYDSLRGSGNHDLINADFNNDGQIDFFLTSDSKSPIQLLEFTQPKNHKLDQQLNDVSHSFGLSNSKLTHLTHWGAASGDFNNDSYQDLFIANGKLTPDPDSHFVPLSQPNTLLINQKGKRFSINENNNIALTNDSSRAAIVTDLNNDGRLEVIVTNNNGTIQILESKQEQDNKSFNWIGFKLTNTHTTNKKAGEIQISYNNNQQLKNLSHSSGLFSQSDQRLHFGLGTSKKIDQMTIQLSNNLFTTSNLVANHYYEIDLQTGKVTKLKYTNKKDPIDQLAKVVDTEALPYLVKILLKNNSPEQIRTLSTIWNRVNATQRLSILKAFSQIENLSHFKLTLLGLSDSNPEVVINAIQILKNSEIEQTMGSLINQLYIENSDIQCATTSALTFFFNEEEAMIFQKKLALKHLIRIIKNAEEQAQICVTKALGASESKRAVTALLNIVLSPNKYDSSVKSAAIDALAEIRDSKAIIHLITLIEAPESKPDEIGTALIALARMQSDNLLPLLENQIYSRLKSNNKSSQSKAIHILNSIYKSSNYIFISQHLHQEHINALIQQIIYQLLPDCSTIHSENQLPLAHSFINIIKSSSNTSLTRFLQSCINSSHIQIREPAILALLKISSSVNEQKEVVSNTLAQQPIEALISLLNFQNSKETSKSVRDILISVLEKKVRMATLTGNQLKNIFTSLGKKTGSKLITKLLSNALVEQQQKKLLGICSKMQFSLNVSDIEGLSSKIELEKEFLTCIYNPNATHEGLPIAYTYQIRKKLNKLLSNIKSERQHSYQILTHAMLHDPIIATHFLKDHSKEFSEENMATALLAIEKHKLLKKYEALIWRIIKNNKNSDSLKMQAIWLANTLSPKQATAFLQKNYYTTQ